MTIKSAKLLEGKKIKIDLTGPDGNVFMLMGYVKTIGRQMGLTEAQIEEVRQDMKSADYDHAVQVFDDQFGDYVDLYR